MLDYRRKALMYFFVINFLSKQPSAPAEQVFKRLNSFSCFSSQHQTLEKSFTRSIFLFFVFLSKICFCKRHLFVCLFLLCHDVRQNITTCVSFQLSSLSLVIQFYFLKRDDRRLQILSIIIGLKPNQINEMNEI